MTVRSFFPLVIDSTMMMAFDSCPMSAFRRYIQHLNSEESVHLVAGKAYARGLEVARKSYYCDGYSPDESLDLGKEALFEAYGDKVFDKPAKSIDRMLMAMELYFFEYPIEEDHLKPAELDNGEFAIEYSFAEELPFKHPELDQNLIFTGRADMLVSYLKKLYVLDDKTTGSPFTANWARQWDTRGQFTTYTWGLQKSGIDVRGAFIRGAYLGKSKIEFQEVLSQRGKFQTETWAYQMFIKLDRILTAYNNWKASGDSPERYFFGAWNETCFSYFSPCQFMDMCRSSSAEKYISSEYDQNIWLPHRQERVPLADFLSELGLE